MSMRTVEILREARELIAHKEHWTQHYMARDAFGRVVDVLDEGATCWCAMGAIRRQAVTDWEDEQAQAALVASIPQRRWIAAFNDTSTHAEVLRVFDDAIAAGSST